MKQYLFHVTDQWEARRWGKKVVLHPRKTGRFRGQKEPKVPRICVCPTVSGCLVARAMSLPSDRIAVYRTARRVESSRPYGVCDVGVTGERWLLKRTTFVRVGTFSAERLPKELWELEITKSKKHLKAQERMKCLVGGFRFMSRFVSV